MDQCSACFGNRLSEFNGIFVCDDCGMQTQIHVEQHEDEYNTAGARTWRGGPRARAIATKEDVQVTQMRQQQDARQMAENYISREEAEARVHGQVLMYAKCLQTMLQAQAEVLVERFHMPPDLASHIRHLWLSFVARSNLLDINLEYVMTTNAELQRQSCIATFYKLREAMALQSRGAALLQKAAQAREAAAAITAATRVPQAAQDVKTDPAAAGGQQPGGQGAAAQQQEQDLFAELKENRVLTKQATHPRLMASTLQRVIHPSDTLLICYLACLRLRLPVTPVDLLRWAGQGHLPYLDFQSRCHELVESVDETMRPPLRRLVPKGCPDTRALMSKTQALASLLRVPLPNVNGELLLLKCCRELHLPEGIFLIARELYIMYFIDTSIMNLEGIYGDVSAHPYICVAAIVVEALKLGYGIGSEPSLGARLPGLPDPPASWIDWAEARLNSPACKPQHYPTSTKQAAELRGPVLLEYLAFCQHNVFPELFKPAEFNETRLIMQKVLERQQQQQQQRQQQQDQAEGTGAGLAWGWEEEEGGPARKRGAGADAAAGGKQQVAAAAAKHLDPEACMPTYMYARFGRPIKKPLVSVDLVALLVVGAAYASESLSGLQKLLMRWEGAMVDVDAEYKHKRRELQAAFGAPVARRAEGVGVPALEVTVAPRKPREGEVKGLESLTAFGWAKLEEHRQLKKRLKARRKGQRAGEAEGVGGGGEERGEGDALPPGDAEMEGDAAGLAAGLEEVLDEKAPAGKGDELGQEGEGVEGREEQQDDIQDWVQAAAAVGAAGSGMDEDLQEWMQAVVGGRGEEGVKGEEEGEEIAQRLGAGEQEGQEGEDIGEDEGPTPAGEDGEGMQWETDEGEGDE